MLIIKWNTHAEGLHHAVLDGAIMLEIPKNI